MKIALLDDAHRPALEVVSALATHKDPNEFCKYLALRTLKRNNVIALCLVQLDLLVELKIVGGFLPGKYVQVIEGLAQEVKEVFLEQSLENIRIAELDLDEDRLISTALIPSFLRTSTSGVLVVLFEGSPDDYSIDLNTQVALAFACEMYCSPMWGNATRDKIHRNRQTISDGEEFLLTPRQNLVLEYIAEGRTNEAIAKLLNYSVATVKNDISAIFQFLDVKNRRDALIEAENRNLLSPPPERSNQALSEIVLSFHKKLQQPLIVASLSNEVFNWVMSANKGTFASAMRVCMCMRMCR